MQQFVAFLCTNNEVAEREIKKIITFPIVTKRMKYIVINLNKEVNDLYSEIYETLIE